MNWVTITIDFLTGLVVILPLVWKLVEFVEKANKEKNWNVFMQMAIDYMTAAEEMFTDGAARKEWVLAMMKTSADTINYNLDKSALAKINTMIESICSAAKIINKETGAVAAGKGKDTAV